MSPVADAVEAIAPPGVLRVGLVLPPSRRYPRLPPELLAGFESGAASARDREIALVPIACGAGARAPIVAATDAVKRGAVDVLAGFVDANAAASMAPLLEQRGIPFVACDMGADVVRHRCENAMVASGSPGLVQASHAMGRWAPAHMGTRALLVADFLESGYDMVYAFREAFESHGGEVVAVEVTGMPHGATGFDSIVRTVRDTRPDFVFAFFSGHRAERFLRFYDAHRLARVAPLAGPGLLTERVTSGELPAGCEGVVTAATWRGEEGSPFAKLGREAARRIAQAAPAETAPAVFLRRLSRSRAGLANVTVDRISGGDLASAACRDLRASVKTGWAQTYLAA